MTVLTIRACKRYATRQKVRLIATSKNVAEGLLIELSAEGCRISNLGSMADQLIAGQPITVELGQTKYCGKVRWAHDGIAGVRLDQALHCHEVATLLELGRVVPPARLYGT
jgi:hypothetical protein